MEHRGNRPILIVEDDPIVSDTFARLLRLDGFHVLTAPDAIAGLRAMAEADPAAVLVDLRMPVVDGVAMVRRIREQENGCQRPVAIITGDYLLDDTIIESLSALNAHLYFKPVWLEELLTIVQTLLAKS